MKRVTALGAMLALLLAPLLVRLLRAQAPSAPPPPPPTYTLTDLGPRMQITAAPSGPTALNGKAQVAGFYFVSSPYGADRAFLWDTGTLTDLGNLGGSPAAFAYGINNNAQIVGSGGFSGSLIGNDQRAFIWQNGTMTPLDSDPNRYSSAFAINSNGDAAGYINNLNNVGGNVPVIWKGGSAAGVTALAGLPCNSSFCQGQALAINDTGQTAGWNNGFVGTTLSQRPVMWDSNGQPTDLGSFGGPANQASGINSGGMVVGFSQTGALSSSPIHAFVWQNGTLQDLGVIPGYDPIYGAQNLTDTSSSAWGINTKGDVVGISAVTLNAALFGSGGRAFLYTNGTMYDLSSLLAAGTNWQLEAAWAINDKGQIVGVGRNPNDGNTEHGFLLTPIVTPTMTTVSSSVNPPVFGQQVSFTATVTATQSSSLTPTGSVTFSDGSTALGTVTLSSGSATFSTSGLGVGTHSITASYAGDNNFGSSTSSMMNQVVNQAVTSAALAVSPNPANLGQTVTFTATVNVVAPGAGTPTGTVTFLDGGTPLGSNVLGFGSTATLSTSSLGAGNHSVTASYGGDATLAGSTSAGVTVTVQGPPPPVQITDNETITVTDTASFPDVFDAENIKVTDQVTVHAFFPITISPAPPILSAVQNQAYSGVTFSGSGGYQSLTLSESGAVPGMSFAIAGASATFSGTPSQTGTFFFTITATDSIGNKLNQSYSLTVSATCPAISVSPSGSLGTLTVGNPFSQAFVASGGVGTTAWSTASALPVGMNFSGGVLSGSPVQFGTFTLIIAATDQNGCQGSSNVSFLVVPPPAVILDNESITVTDAASFPDVFDAENVKVTDQVTVHAFFPIAISPAPPILSAVQNQLYSGVTFSGSGGYQSLTLSESGAVPGMSFAINGAFASFSGTPTQSGTFPFTITATDTIGNALKQNYSLVVAASCPAISVSPSGSLGTLTVGNPFSQTFVASGGVGTTAWSTASALPVGMNFSGGVLSGSPVQFGTFTLIIAAADQNGCQGSSNVSVLVVPPPAVITDNETITVTDAVSFPDVFDAQKITVTDQVSIQVLNATTTSITLNGAAVFGVPVGGTVSVSSSTAAVTGNVTLSVDGGSPVTLLPSNGSATFNLGSLSVGPHALAANFPAQGNFLASSAATKFAVAQATPTIGWKNPAPIIYGASLGSAQLNAAASVPGSFVYSPAAGTLLTAGTQTLSVVFTPTDTTDYTTATATVTLLVNPATPTITWANPAPITYGTPLSTTELNATASVKGMFTYSVALGTVLGAGSQTLSVKFNPADTTDYTPAVATLTLLVNQATPTITWVNPPAITFGTALSGKQLNATVSWAGATVPGTLVYNPPAGTVLGAGSQTLSVVFASNDKVDYTKANASVTLVVNQATPVITWANPAPITQGTPLSSVQLNATASVSGVSLPGTFVYNPPLKTVLGAGTQTLSVTFTPADITDYQTVTQNVSIIVNVSGNLSIQPGQNVTFNNGSISGNVTLSGGTLTLIGSTVGGSLTMSSGSLTLSGNSTVSNNVQIQGGSFSIGQASIKGNLQIMNVPAGKAPGVVCGATVSGDLQFQYNAIPGQIGPSSCSGNRIGGNLQITNNTAPLQIFKNAVGGNLQVQSNTGSAQVFQNTVQNMLQCSGNSSPFTGGKNTAAGKQGQCVSF